jgi:hypothetical protein
MRLESYSFKTTKCDIKNYKHQKIKYKILLLTSLGTILLRAKVIQANTIL